MKAKPSILEVQIKDFRAIGTANIRLDGITVLTGENGCGKSTISKLLYSVFKISQNYTRILEKELEYRINKLIALSRADLQATAYIPLNRRKEFIDDKGKFILSLKQLKGLFEVPRVASQASIYRIQQLILLDFRDYITKEVSDNEDLDVERIFEVIENIIENIYREFEDKKAKRPSQLFEKKLKNLYSEKLNNFAVLEFGAPIIQTGNNYLGYFDAIDTTIYIDSPMAVEVPKYEYYKQDLELDNFSHWYDLDFYLKKKHKKHLEELSDTPIYKEILALFSSQEILDGDIILDESNRELIYHRSDGKSFKVVDCATGVKSIAALQTLYKNGWLTHKTLLLLDEPEAHLHPQWVVEYARLVVLLNKKVGVNFLISSHDPDMVSAIQDICDKEELNKNLRFYLAKRQNNYTYNFVDQKVSVGEIFDSFNIAIEKINEYGGEDE